MKKRLRLKKWVLILLFIIFLCSTLYYSYKVILWKIHVDRNSNIQKEIKDIVDIPVIEEINEENYNIDFNKLKEINSDVVAYIKVFGTNIDYVVVKGQDNNYYLNHNLKKEYNIAGWVFADYNNRFDETDKNIVIYGHNTHDNSMFGTLNKVLDKSWQSNLDNLEILFITENNKYIYKVFSTYIIEPEDYYINTKFNSDSEYSIFLETIKSRSNNDYNVELDINDKILTLSSCINDGKKRVVLHAKLEG